MLKSKVLGMWQEMLGLLLLVLKGRSHTYDIENQNPCMLPKTDFSVNQNAIK